MAILVRVDTLLIINIAALIYMADGSGVRAKLLVAASNGSGLMEIHWLDRGICAGERSNKRHTGWERCATRRAM